MGEEFSNFVNLELSLESSPDRLRPDLNLEPEPTPDDIVYEPYRRLSESMLGFTYSSTDFDQFLVNSDSKTCENGNKLMKEESIRVSENKKSTNSNEGSFFDCYICLDLANEPVVTNCGHLYCWACIYQWLQQPSIVKECPVCKGEVSEETLTPIYGRGKSNKRGFDEVSSVKIPSRPQARRRRARASSPVSLEENLFSFASDIDFYRELRNELRRPSRRLSIEESIANLRNQEEQNNDSVIGGEDRDLFSSSLPVDSFVSEQEVRIDNLWSSLRELLPLPLHLYEEDNNDSVVVGGEDRDDSLSSIVGEINTGNQVDTVSTSSSERRYENGLGRFDLNIPDPPPLRRRRLID